MKRILLAAVAAIAAGSAGCQRDFVAGRCDCQYVPENMVLKPAGNPYPVIGSPSSGAPATNYSVPLTPAPDKSTPEAMPKPEVVKPKVDAPKTLPEIPNANF